jgi:hypothetical protein
LPERMIVVITRSSGELRRISASHTNGDQAVTSLNFLALCCNDINPSSMWL